MSEPVSSPTSLLTSEMDTAVTRAALTCNCHQYGSARLCPVHMQIDFDAQRAMSEKEAIERVAGVIAKYRHRPAYTEYAVAALVLDALRWPRMDGSVPGD